MGIKRSLSSLLFIAILVVQLGFSLLLTTGRVSAEPFSSDNPLETEYTQWRAYKIVSNCFDSEISLSTNGNDQDIANRIFDHNKVSDGIGHIYNTALGGGIKNGRDGGGEIDCNTILSDDHASILKYALKPLGFDNIRDFANALTGVNPTQNTTLSKAQAQTALNEIMRSGSLGGRGGSHDTLSEGAIFWYWNELFTSSLCGGRRSSTDTGSGTRVSGGPFYYYKPSTDERSLEIDNLGYAYVSKDDNIEKHLDIFVPEDKMSIEAPCRELLGEMTETRRNDYIAKINSHLNANPGATAGSFINMEPAESTESCESRMPLSAGWMVCNALDFIGNVLDEFMNVVDSMLNIDSQKLENSEGLRNSWSYFRAIATFLLLAVGLIMVIGQAIGGGR